MIQQIDGTPAPRVGAQDHWDLYERAIVEQPALVTALAAAISVAIEAELVRANIVNSSWLGARVLEQFSQRDAWNAYVRDEQTSRGLFGMIVWTVISDDERTWLSTLTNNTNVDTAQRVYWLDPAQNA